MIQHLPGETTVLPVQALGELFNLLVRKAGCPPAKARAAILSWRDAFPLLETSPAILLAATDLATGHPLGLWDAVIVSASAEAGCRLLIVRGYARRIYVARRHRDQPICQEEA